MAKFYEASKFPKLKEEKDTRNLTWNELSILGNPEGRKRKKKEKVIKRSSQNSSSKVKLKSLWSEKGLRAERRDKTGGSLLDIAHEEN